MANLRAFAYFKLLLINVVEVPNRLSRLRACALVWGTEDLRPDSHKYKESGGKPPQGLNWPIFW
ncbi:hypothetical protein D910_08281 [Dendroctonus ponderosae]|uniref:Uncharacterized protein n=1 Tax=Dendroctonus ponderosae TaxID=77166 RepID=U4UAK0_DENPD|nr:hypothetical protein D910_08281 [Dendroctonus ponderosae]